MARASSIRLRKAFSAADARGGNSWRWMRFPDRTPQRQSGLERQCFDISIVVLPIPRTGVLITRNSEIESSGFWMTFKYEIMSLISARS